MIHVPALEDTKGMINKDTIQPDEKDVVITPDFARYCS